MNKKIAIASLAQESNSFSPFLTDAKAFTTLRGEDVLNKFTVAAEVFRDADCCLVPSLSAYALPGGAVEINAFYDLCKEIVDNIPADVDGIWLHLHGAMYVQNLEEYNYSGEEYLLVRLREKVGRAVPIAACMDMHANHTLRFAESIDIVRGYHTAPHERWDYDNCCRKTANALLEMISGRHMRSYLQPLPLRLPGERFMTGFSPAKETIELSDSLEELSGVICATLFVGMAWCDTKYNTLSIFLTVDDTVKAPERIAAPLCDFVIGRRKQYDIPAKNTDIEAAISICEQSGKRPFYISDSGDNVTAGAAGDNALCLKVLLDGNRKNYLVAGITDEEFVETCFDKPKGTVCEVSIGGKTDRESVCVCSSCTVLGSGIKKIGALKKVKYVLAKFGDNFVIATNIRCDFVDPIEISEIAGNLSEYTAVIVKLGYLFPLLAESAAESCIALTPGNCSLDMAQINYTTKAFFE